MSDQEELSVKSLINYDKKDKERTEVLIMELNKLGEEYISLLDNGNPERLEQIKRKFGGYLNSLSTYFAKVKAFKYNGDYFEEERKRFKSEAIQLIVERDKMSIAAAEKVVYSEPYYKDRVELMQALKKFFIKVELKYARYVDIARDIYQSVSQTKQDNRYSGE